MLADSLRRQSVQIFSNIQYLLDDLDETLLDKIVGGFPLWKQVYHMLHSMDKNFIDPSRYMEPDFHSKNLDVIFLDMGDALSRKDLVDYFAMTRIKIEDYLNGLNDPALEESIAFRDLKLTRLELALAQFRHIFYHIGYLHCCIKIEKGRTPEYVGIYKTIPEK